MTTFFFLNVSREKTPEISGTIQRPVLCAILYMKPITFTPRFWVGVTPKADPTKEQKFLMMNFEMTLV